VSKKSDKRAGLEPEGYKQTLHHLQVELVKLQRHLIKNDLQILILIAGRDVSGKGGVIKRITAHLSRRETRIVALGKPSDQDRDSWYFKRYVASLPASQKMVISVLRNGGFQRSAILTTMQALVGFSGLSLVRMARQMA
jgi:polyphosphate kinase